MDAGFGAAGEHYGGVAVRDEARRVADGVGACCAGCGYSVIGALGGKLGWRFGSMVGKENLEAVFH